VRRAAAAVDDGGRAERVTPVGAWGLFIDGGAWLTLDGIRVDWIYRDLDRQTAAVEEGRAGRANEKGAVRRAAALPGAPDGFGVTVEQVLAAPGADPDALLGSLYAFRELRATVAARFDRG
jgi:hypothetical protein